MSRRINQLRSVLNELQDRYGPNDPVVLQMKDTLLACETTVSQTALPFGERRSGKTLRNFLKVKRQGQYLYSNRSEIMATCNRIEQRVSS